MRLLPDYSHAESPISAVYPHARHLSAKVRSFVDFLAGRFGERPPWDAWMECERPSRVRAPSHSPRRAQ